MAKKQTKSADKKTNKVLVNVVLDRSGSMASVRESTRQGYNEYIHGLRKDTATDYSVTLIQFDEPMDYTSAVNKSGPELTISYVDQPLADVKELELKDYEPRGNTPLYDAIGECIRRVDAKKRSVLTVVITDGMENASKEFTLEQIKGLIKAKEAEEHWTFVFLGADLSATYHVAASAGYQTGNTVSYSKGATMQAFGNLGQATMARSYVARTEGVQAAGHRSMFSADMKSDMGDTDQGSSLGQNLDPTVTTGGLSAAQSIFPGSPATNPVDPKRKWKSKPVSKP